MTSIAETAIRIMRENNIKWIMWGDSTLVTIYYAAGRPDVHPVKAMASVLNALSRSDAFEAAHVNAHDSRARARVVRMFKPKGSI